MARHLSRRQVLRTAALGVAAGSVAAGFPPVLRAQTREIVLDYWHPETREAAVAQEKKWIAEFEKANPGVRVKYTVVPWGELNTKIRAANATHTLPDLIYTYAASHAGWSYEGVTQPVDDIIDAIGRADFDDAYLRYVTVNGKAYAVPWFGWNHVLYYRKDWYDQAKLKPIKGWADWLANVKALHKPPERFGLLIYNANDAEVKYLVSLIALNGGTMFDRDLRVVVNSPEVVEALRFYKDLARYAPPGWQDKGETEQRLAFLKGVAAHIESSTSFADNIRQQMKEDPGIRDKIAAVALPINKGDRGGWVAFSGLAITRSTRHRDAARKLLLALFQKERYLEYVQNTVTGWTPVTKSATANPAYWSHANIKPFESVLRGGIEAGRKGVMEAQTYGPHRYAHAVSAAHVWKEAADLLTLRDKSAEEVAAWMQKRVEEVVKEAG
jgi:multiple sugar transport system substrate-binding protein